MPPVMKSVPVKKKGWLMKAKERRWFDCKVIYERVGESNLVERVTENYLVEALSFSETERRVTEELAPSVRGEFHVKAVCPSNYSDVIMPESSTGGKWYKSKIEWLTENEETGKEKKLSTFVLVRSKDISSSIRMMEDFYKELAQDYSIVGITEKNYIDILK